MKKGVITVYLAIIFSILLSMILSAVEAAKYSAYRVVAECALKNALISAFGEYNRELFNQYDLLYIDLSYLTDQVSFKALTDRVSGYMNENLDAPDSGMLFAKDLFGKGTAEVRLRDCQMASDLFGSNLKKQAVEYIKGEIPADLPKDLLSLIRVKEEYSLDEESFRKTKEDLDKEAEMALKDKDGDKGGKELEDVKTVRNLVRVDWDLRFIRPIMVVLLKEDAFNTSGRSFSQLDVPSTRITANINGAQNFLSEVETDPFAEAYFTEYIMRKTGNYVHPKQNSYLQYETEYIIGGSNVDTENLNRVIVKIFYIRSAANLISLLGDQEKREAVDQIAEGLSAICEIPAPVISGIILCMWAAGEATFDVEELCKGKKLALIKDADDFHLSLQGGLNNLISDKSFSNHGGTGTELTLAGETELGSFSGNSKNITEKINLSYEDYLRILVQYTNPYLKTLRMMDIIELDVRQTPDNNTFRIDWCLNAAVFEVTVTSEFGARYEIKRRYSY